MSAFYNVHMRLMREVRFFPGGREDAPTGTLNAWSGTRIDGAVGAFRVLRAVVTGRVNEQTGYVCSITDIDKALRSMVVPRLIETVTASIGAAARSLLEGTPAMGRSCPAGISLVSLELDLSPYLRLTSIHGDTSMIQLTQSFEFAAAHRLFRSELSDEENRRTFGKCANPNGHGHNYVVEVTIAGEPDERTGTLIETPRLEQIVHERVIAPFDHKHLNLDCPEFATLNPSVENIARVIWSKLDGALSPACLAKVRVWETPKTYAEYDGS